MSESQLCPCGSEATYQSCCGLIHENGAGLGRSARQLMQARYTAYTLGDESFLLRSWHVDTRPTNVTFDDNVEWIGLEVLAATTGSGFDTEGTVEFKARYLRSGQPLELHEISSFVRVDGSWVYVDGR